MIKVALSNREARITDSLLSSKDFAWLGYFNLIYGVRKNLS